MLMGLFVETSANTAVKIHLINLALAEEHWAKELIIYAHAVKNK